MKNSLLMGILLAGLFTQANGYADDDIEYTCRWYFIQQCGAGHGGGVKFIEEDDKGDIWTTTGNYRSSSLWQFDGKQWHRRYSVGRKSSSLWSAAHKRGDGLYVATEQGLVHFEDGLLTLHTRMPIIQGYGPSTFHTVGNPTFNAVPTTLTYVDKRGDPWAYAPKIGLFRYTGGIWNEHTTYVPHDGGHTKLADLLEGAAVTAMHTSSKDAFWVGVDTGSLYLLKQKPSSLGRGGTDVELTAKHTAKAIGIPKGATITSITNDSKERIWIAFGKGRTEGGAVCLTEGRWQVFTHANSSLPLDPPRPWPACQTDESGWASIGMIQPLERRREQRPKG